MSETQRKSKFKNVAQGAAALDAEWARQNPPESKDRRPKDSERKIKILSEANPRREGTKGFEYFASLAKSKTVGEYLSQYSGVEARDARLWMNSNIKAGYAELV
jgi:hypothetical protein